MKLDNDAIFFTEDQERDDMYDRESTVVGCRGHSGLWRKIIPA